MGRRYRFTFLAWGTQTDFVPETYILYLNKRESLQLSGGFLNGCFLIYTHNVHVNFRYFETMTALCHKLFRHSWLQDSANAIKHTTENCKSSQFHPNCTSQKHHNSRLSLFSQEGDRFHILHHQNFTSYVNCMTQICVHHFSQIIIRHMRVCRSEFIPIALVYTISSKFRKNTCTGHSFKLTSRRQSWEYYTTYQCWQLQ